MGNSLESVNTPTSASPVTCDINNLANIIKNARLVNFRVSCHNGELSVCGGNLDGQQVSVQQYQSNGFSEVSCSTYQQIDRQSRQHEVRRLRGHGLSQQQIANRLGVSQSTISNDLRN